MRGKSGSRTAFGASLCLILLAALFLSAPLAVGQSIRMMVWAVSDCDKVLRDEPPWDESAVWSRSEGVVRLHAARNEYAAFQLMITAEGGELRGVRVTASDLRREGSILPAGDIELFREYYLYVTEPSTSMYGEQSSTGPGWYPDPLVPLDSPDGGAPFDVQEGSNQGVWVDIYVPEGTPSGVYVGFLTISADERGSVSIPLELRVWGFTLPRESHLGSFFLYQPGQIADAHGVSKYGDLYLEIEAEYARTARRHRCNFSTSVYPEYHGTGNGTIINWDSWHDDLAARHLDGIIFPDGRGIDLYTLPIGQDYPDPGDHGGLGSQEFEDTFSSMLRQFRDHFVERGWYDRSFLYIVDEPNDEEAYELVRYYGELVDRSATGFPLMVTESPLPQDPAWGSLVGSVDIWCAGGDAWPGPMHERQAAGDAAWTYNGGEPYAGSQLIDTSGIGPRSWAWITRSYGVECWLLWDVCYFKDIYNGCTTNDVWSDPLTYDQRRSGTTWPDWGNGDGTLFYPGTPRGIEGPVESLRLKSWRRGAQDYEYMWLLDRQGKAGLVNSLVEEVIPYAFGDAEGKITSWSKNCADWEGVRLRMGEELDGSPGFTHDYYFAEGYTGPGFHTWLCLSNTAAEEVYARVTYLYSDRPAGERYLSLPPDSRTTLYLNPDVGDEREFSLVVEASLDIVCERPMYFDYRPPP